MKDYLKENLTDDEKAHVYKKKKKTALKYMKKFIMLKERETVSLDNENVSDEKITVYDNYNFVDKVLETKILKDISDLKPYSQYEKERLVNMLENIALDSGLYRFIVPLTFNEKLVVLLLYLENYQVNEVAALLGVNRKTIWQRDRSIKNKIKKIKEKLKNEK